MNCSSSRWVTIFVSSYLNHFLQEFDMNAFIKVLIVVTSYNQLGDTGKPTGYYLPEVSHPYMVLEQAGFQVDIASPQGGKAPMDESSRDLSDSENKAFLSRPDLVQKIENTIPLSKVNAKDYKAIFFAGGHGTMWDFPQSADLARIAGTIYDNSGVVAAVCHGPAALVNVKLANGRYLVDGKELTSFSNAEEAAIEMTTVMPFLLETALVARGGRYTKAGLWQEKVVVSERLVTGQNPASAHAVGVEMVKLLSR